MKNYSCVTITIALISMLGIACKKEPNHSMRIKNMYKESFTNVEINSIS